MATKLLKIAALACSYNRKEKTSAFLNSLSNQSVPDGYVVDIYLLDDKSSDGTAGYVKQNFPDVTIIEGTGSLYWAGGMRTVWAEALKRGNYDFFLLLNDDVKLSDDAVARLIAAHTQCNFDKNIVLGTVQDAKTLNITYGGHRLKNTLTGYAYNVPPDPEIIQEAYIGNANVMLVDKGTVDKIGILHSAYVHGLADYDYTIRAVKNGVKVWVAPGYYGFCENDHGKNWLPAGAPFKKRLAYLYSPTGLAYKQYLYYVRKHYPLMLPGVFIKAWLKTLFPILYDTVKK